MNALMKEAPAIIPVRNFSHRIKVFDWERVSNDLDARGRAIIENLVTSEECDALVRLYAVEDIFRSRVVMGHHGFGRGEYKYFRYPSTWHHFRTADVDISPAGACCKPLE